MSLSVGQQIKDHPFVREMDSDGGRRVPPFTVFISRETFAVPQQSFRVAEVAATAFVHGRRFHGSRGIQIDSLMHFVHGPELYTAELKDGQMHFNCVSDPSRRPSIIRSRFGR